MVFVVCGFECADGLWFIVVVNSCFGWIRMVVTCYVDWVLICVGDCGGCLGGCCRVRI